MLNPDYIFETSWEVCNQVGGIYAVLSTRAASMQKEHPDKVFFFGPDFGKHSDIYFKEDKSLLSAWRKVQDPRIPIRIGRWAVPGEPITILLGAENLWPEKDAIYAWAWEKFGVRSHAAYGDYDESCLFGYAAGQVMASLADYLKTKTDNPKIVAHANEWQTAFSIFYLREHCPQIGTLFTTHATGIGRSIAGNGKPLYDCFEGFHGDQMAEELNMVSKHSVEKMAARWADCFTTVSDITAKECKQEAQPFHVKASLQGIHSAALHTSVSGLHAVLDSDKRLRIFCGNTEYAGKPAPQNSTGTAKGDCRSDTDDITGTDRCGKRGCQRAE